MWFMFHVLVTDFQIRWIGFDDFGGMLALLL